MSLKNKYIAVIGAGESGVGAALLAQKLGAEVFVSDYGKIKENYKKELEENSISFEENGHSLHKIEKADEVIKSPGIPQDSAVIQHLKKTNIRLISEIEFASRYSQAKTICITGSNGKTTTTMLVYHIFQKAGYDVGFGGNIGKSFARQLAVSDCEYYILELSSFQLDDLQEFKADISIILNITPDHLDRYEYNMDLYVDSKLRIINNQTKDDWLIYNADDSLIKSALEKKSPNINIATFSLTGEQQVGGHINKEQLIINIKDQFTMSIHDLALKGKHNTQNSLAAGIAARIVEIRKDIVRQSLEDFVNVEHRLEFVAKINGVEFINDSKATNINSTWFALESMEKPTVWIVGGVDKGNDYNELLSLVDEKVKAIICLGEDNDKIKEAFQSKVETLVEARDAVEAVAYAYRLARKDDSVLLSPACASFDLFESYEDRGNQFKQAVRML
ncbi:UDP-N-acetylmuramoyl-L-alanine--D-glutamate ligase [Crocinitomicaceae bacterium]|nr:UDP-N-acetylmuramoyl-L-alanine--D-glutamate ligase [Crocinitomicaceae bacterium]MDC1361771.1 UDP-N-acetylmuramoyl-L-alanine--D-glutamate ligase [Crocinitomicaceae bacterium]